MPEGPELHLAAELVKSVGLRHTFEGAIVKSEVSNKNPEVTWNCKGTYNITGLARGKEMKVIVSESTDPSNICSILFHFGMSGKFEWTTIEDLPKHAHLRFFSAEDDMVLSFVDYRRFGRWYVNAEWSTDRGPCIITEADNFRHHVLKNLEDKAFDKPICEAMLDQRFFNGVGNYLRAEVLFRLRIRPFEKARNVLEPMKKVKSETKDDLDFLTLINTLANEVVGLGFDGGYFSETKDKWESGFGQWLQCYFKDGMKSIKDHNGRTMWFKGEPGPMAPSSNSEGRKKAKKEVSKRQIQDLEPSEKKLKIISVKNELNSEIKSETKSLAQKTEKSNVVLKEANELNSKKFTHIQKSTTGSRKSERLAKSNKE